MELELHQLDRRYEQLRSTNVRRESLVLASLDRHGQQVPVVVVVSGGDEERYVLVDGYKRVRGLTKLRQDTVRATCWDLSEADALLLERMMQSRSDGGAMEQGWLLRELRDRFDLTVEELARRFDRSPSWVSGRLGLVGELPEPIQQEVRRGRLLPHAVMKYLLPLSRADRQGALALATAIAPLQPSNRQTEALCVAYARGNAKGREYLLRHPGDFLRARERQSQTLPTGPGELLLRDLEALVSVARRGRGRVKAGAVRELTPPEQLELARRAQDAWQNIEKFLQDLKREQGDVGSTAQNDNSHAP